MDKPKPYIVRTVEGVRVKEYAEIEQAQASAKDRNERAAEMGIKTRYEATDNPAFVA